MKKMLATESKTVHKMYCSTPLEKKFIELYKNPFMEVRGFVPPAKNFYVALAGVMGYKKLSVVDGKLYNEHGDYLCWPSDLQVVLTAHIQLKDYCEINNIRRAAGSTAMGLGTNAVKRLAKQARQARIVNNAQ